MPGDRMRRDCCGTLEVRPAASQLGQSAGAVEFTVYLLLTLGLGMGAHLSQAVGKSANMSDRTHIWEVLLSVPINPLLGTGYQSFWLGPRVAWVWARLNGDNVMEAHNGYLAIYLELGLIGLFLLCTFLIATYRKICKRLTPLTPVGSLGLGLWTLLLFYNVTEAAFGGGLLWITLLMGSLTVPQRSEDEVDSPQPLALSATEQATDVSFEVAGPWTRREYADMRAGYRE